jgi:hypothetical protein
VISYMDNTKGYLSRCLTVECSEHPGCIIVFHADVVPEDLHITASISKVNGRVSNTGQKSERVQMCTCLPATAMVDCATRKPRVHCCVLKSPSPDALPKQSNPEDQSVFILFSHLNLGFASYIFASVFPTKTLCVPST